MLLAPFMTRAPVSQRQYTRGRNIPDFTFHKVDIVPLSHVVKELFTVSLITSRLRVKDLFGGQENHCLPSEVRRPRLYDSHPAEIYFVQPGCLVAPQGEHQQQCVLKQG